MVSQPRLLLTPYKLIFYAGADTPQNTKTIKIKNSGGGSLGAAVVTTDPAASWLDVQTDGTSAITFALRSDVVRRGAYQTVVSVTVDGALGSPASVPVTLIADETYPAPDGGVPISGGLDSAVASNAGDDGGVAEGDAPSAGNSDADAPITKGDSGCGCTLGGQPRGTELLFLVGLAVLCLARRRSKQ
jgi:MYXO-CTERM domain-containing protein